MLMRQGYIKVVIIKTTIYIWNYPSQREMKRITKRKQFHSSKKMKRRMKNEINFRIKYL